MIIFILQVKKVLSFRVIISPLSKVAQSGIGLLRTGRERE